MSLPSLTVYVANMAEDVWSYLDTLSPEAKAADLLGCDYTCDRELSAFLATPNFVLISPLPLDPAFITYIHSFKPKNYFDVLVPTPKTGQICLDVKNDPGIISAIEKLSTKYSLRLESYTASREFTALVDLLRSQNPAITAPLTPPSSRQSVVDSFGTKSGLRQFYDRHKTECSDFVMAAGKICTHKTEAFAYAQSLIASGLGVVFKTPKGHSGIGVVLVKPSQSAVDFSSLLSEPYWDRFPLIVEEYVPIDHSVGGGTPNAEGIIHENGQVEILYTCGMRVDESGGFRGMEIGPAVLPDSLVAKLHRVGTYLGTHYAQMGYRGYFDIDGMIDKNGNLIISESNVRRTGGTHVFRLAQALLGADFPQHYYFLSNNYYPLPKGDWNFSNVFSLLRSIVYNPISRSGLLITGTHPLRDNYLSYALLAPTQAEIQSLQSRLDQIFSPTS